MTQWYFKYETIFVHNYTVEASSEIQNRIEILME